MEVGDLYQFVLLVVLVGMLVGVGMVVLANFEASTAVVGASSVAINNTITAIATIPSTWLGLIITVSALAIVLGLIIRSFGANR